MSGYFNLDNVDVDAITRIVQASVPAATDDEVRDFIDADWPNADEHQGWLDSATADEVADWVASVLLNTHPSLNPE